MRVYIYSFDGKRWNRQIAGRRWNRGNRVRRGGSEWGWQARHCLHRLRDAQFEMVREPGPSEVHPAVTVVIPTLDADESLTECLESLERQTFSDFEVDRGGQQRPEGGCSRAERVRVIANERNVGFGAAFNQAFHASARAVSGDFER